MMFRTHIAFSVLVGLISLKFFNVENYFLYFVFVILSSMIVDIDIPKSKVGSKIKPVSWLIERLLGHRGIFHSIYPVIFFYILFFYVVKMPLIGLAVVIGYLSHIFIDLFNKEGITLLPPFKISFVSGFIKTGGIVEYFIFISLVVIDIIIMGWFV
jgi:inner membrane protein